MPFTSVQLLHRLTRRLKVRDVGNLDAAARLELLDAANAGLNELAALMPQTRRETPADFTLPAPLTLTLDLVTGARAFSYVGGAPWPVGGYADESSLLGHSVSAGTRLNRLHRPGELLAAHLGSSGQQSVTFHGDAAAMGQNQSRLLGRPTYSDATGSRTLIPAHSSFSLHPSTFDLSTGTPEYFWTEPLLGTERTSSPLWLIRVWPLPTVLGTLTCRLETLPEALSLEDFTTPRDLPVEDREAAHLIALCEEFLAGSSLLDGGQKPGDLLHAALRARDHFASAPQQLDTRPRRLRTPRGW